MNKIDFYGNKKIWWDLIIFYKKQEQTERVKKIIESLENSWKEFENKNKDNLY